MNRKSGPQISIFHGLLLIVFAFFFQGCIGTIEENIINEIKKEQFPKKNLLDKHFDNDSQIDIQFVLSKDILEEGNEEPIWSVKDEPKECGKEYICGTARKGSISGNECPNKFYCVQNNKLSAKSDMSYRMGTKITARQSDRAYSERDNEGENVFSQYEEQTRAKGAQITLKGVLFRHYYWTPEKVLLTLAMMKNPKYKTEADVKTEADNKTHNLYLALSIDNNDNFVQNEITKITNILLKEILDKHSYIISNQGRIHPYSMEEVSSIDEQVKLIAEQFPDSLLLLLSLTGNIMENSGDMFPSITVLYMSFSAYSPEGQIFWKKTYEAKRLNTKKVTKLNTSEKKRSFIKTLEKGFDEIKKKGLLSGLKSSL
jgi:hypothetical protein